VILLGFSLQQGHGQFTEIDQSVINVYTPIVNIYCADDNDVDSLVVGNLAGFSEGDTVMVYCIKGAEIKTAPDGVNGNGGPLQTRTNPGKYAIMIINEIVVPGNIVVLNTSFTEIGPLKTGEQAQLIRIPTYRRARLVTELTAPDWNGSTGGVVALFVQRTLELNADINVSGKGFRGADPSPDPPYIAGCAIDDPVAFDSTFYRTDGPVIRAGRKGEGATSTAFNLLRGKGKNVNGGGGGNGRLSGGGGGSNWNFGGKGGMESSAVCQHPGIDTRGMGGFDMGRNGFYYINDYFFTGNCIFFGGGGGTGTRVTGRTTTKGGDGGGIVVIVADSIVGNGHAIIADGESVTAVATGAGGGGGGGGAIVLDVGSYGSTLSLRAIGGDGGDTNFPGDTTGPGGGGGGGIYWYAGSTHPQLDMELTAKAAKGICIPFSSSHGAEDGTVAGKLGNLRTPLRGFLFNTVPDEFTVCANEIPDPIIGSFPKGGDGTYTYLWIDSTSTHTWQPAPGTNNQKDYTFPGPLSDTTYFRRVVTSGVVLPADTSFRITFNVHPAITGNTVTAPDTVCSGNAPQLFVSSSVIGGGLGPGTYSYKWQKEEGTGIFNNADGTITQPSYQAPGLTTTTQFRRIAYSGACEDTTGALTVKVWERLTGNDITPNDTICFNTAPDLITGPVPGEGDPADKRYRWEIATDPEGTWSQIGGATNRTYQSPALTQTRYIRRIVLSGSDDACVDTSNHVEILNIPLITNNTVSGTATVCRGDQAPLLTGTEPGGGYQGQYSYRWEARTSSTSWGPAPGANNVMTGYGAGIMDGDTTLFRRVVGSGGAARNVCQSTSNQVFIHVLPSITGNVITTADDMKCQGDLLEDLTQDPGAGPAPGGGATVGGVDPTRRYRWEVATGLDTPGVWQEIAGEASLDYAGNPLMNTEQDRWYRRIVFSGSDEQCIDTSNWQRIIVHREITNNTIEPFDSVCFGTTKLLAGSTPSGEPEITTRYTWRDTDSGDPLPASDEEDHEAGPYNSLDPRHYERIASIGECTDTSNAMQLTVMQLPGGRLTDDPFRACEYDTVLFIDVTADRLHTFTLPWEVTLTDGVRPDPVGPFVISADGNLGVTLETEADSTQYNYEIASITYASPGGRYLCEAPADSLSGTVPIEVFRVPEPVITPADSAKVCDITITLAGDPDHGTGTWSQVNTDKPQMTFSDPGSEQTAVFIQDISERYGEYRIRYRSVAGDCYGDEFIDVTFFEQPEPAYAGADTMIFFINSIQLHADPPTAGTGTWTLEEGSGIIHDLHDPETYAYELALGEENTFRWTVENGEGEGKCVTYSDVVIVIRNEVKRYTGFSPNKDADNEYYIMQGLKYADEFTITFFNALGNTVRTITHENVDQLDVTEALVKNGLQEDEMVVWDGRSENGNLVPSGTYYYVVDFLLHQRDPVSGAITRTDKYNSRDYVVVKRD